MKVVLSLFAILFGLSAFAGPEDHLPYQTCYSLSTGFASAVKSGVPAQLCLDSLQVEVKDLRVSAPSYVQPEYFGGLKVKQLVQWNEDKYEFTAKSVVKANWDSACGAGEVLSLKVSGFTDSLGEANLDKLSVSLERLSVVDTCHSQPQVETFTYVK